MLLSLEVAISRQGFFPKFPASFLAVIDQNNNAPDAFTVADPELTFLKEVMKFRDYAFQHVTDDAMKFFNKNFWS